MIRLTAVTAVIAALFLCTACGGGTTDPAPDTGNENAERYGSECADHTDCSNPPADWCDSEQNMCVECRDDGDCGGDEAYCESNTDSAFYGKCVACDTDGDCSWQIDCDDPKQPTCIKAAGPECACRSRR